MRIGVDTGGTFTDCVVRDGSRFKILKVFSTPDDPAKAMGQASRHLASREPGAALTLIHGTTVGTNSVLERRGARVVLLTTAGFEDLIEIGRQNRPELYNLDVRREPPLVTRRLRWGVEERTAADGKILLRPTHSELRGLRQRVKRSGAESVAVCFLFSFANPANERAVARALRPLGLPVSVSHEILPEFREFERLSTVAMNAYLALRLGRYLARLEQETKRRFIVGRGTESRKRQNAGARIYVMQSSGGITSAARAAREPVRTILSGPAGGVVAAAWLAESLGIRRAISFDMGGTSTDVCLLDGGPRTTHETTLGDLPVAVPVLDVHSVGAGGGSLARLDAGGALRVGPESAGSVPGPICYGRGGTTPAVTDAHLLLGRMDRERFLGGEFGLDEEAARRHFENFLRRGGRGGSGRMGGLRNPRDLARGIIAVSNATMGKALRVISVERGHDPRDFSLVAFGGAGGLHAADLARSLGLKKVIVPPNPGVFSALGILISDVVRDVSRSVLLAVPSEIVNSRVAAARKFLRILEGGFTQLDQAARRELRRDRLPAATARSERKLGIRYQGQSYELAVPFTRRFAEEFHREHEKAYGYADAGRPLEIVNLRLRLVIRTPKPRLRPMKAGRGVRLETAIVGRKAAWFDRRLRATPFHDRERLQPGTRIGGPAVVVEYSSTTVIPPGFVCRVDEYLNLVLRPHA